MKIEADDTVARFFRFASKIMEFGLVTIENGVLTLRGLDRGHTAAVEIVYTVPAGTPVQEYGKVFRRGVRTEFLANALKNGLAVSFLEDRLLAEDGSKKARQAYVALDGGEDFSIDEVVQKNLSGGVQGSLDVRAIRGVEKFGLELGKAIQNVTLEIEGTEILVRFSRDDTGFDYEDEVGSVASAVEVPFHVTTGWDLLEPMLALGDRWSSSNITIQTKPKMPLLFTSTKKASEYSDKSAQIGMRYIVAPRIEYEEAPVTPAKAEEEEPEEPEEPEGAEQEQPEIAAPAQ